MKNTIARITKMKTTAGLILVPDEESRGGGGASCFL